MTTHTIVYQRNGISLVVGSETFGVNGGSVMPGTKYHHSVGLSWRMFNTLTRDQYLRQKDMDAEENTKRVEGQLQK
jgi:hypothetical protein